MDSETIVCVLCKEELSFSINDTTVFYNHIQNYHQVKFLHNLVMAINFLDDDTMNRIVKQYKQLICFEYDSWINSTRMNQCIYEDNYYSYEINPVRNEVGDAGEGLQSTFHPNTQPQTQRSFCPPRVQPRQPSSQGGELVNPDMAAVPQQITSQPGDRFLDSMALDLTPGRKNLLGMRGLQLTPQGTNVERCNNLKRAAEENWLKTLTKRKPTSSLSATGKENTILNPQKKLKVHLPQLPSTSANPNQPQEGIHDKSDEVKLKAGKKGESECKLCPMKMNKIQLRNHMSSYHRISKKVCLLEVGHEKKQNKQYILQCYHCLKIHQKKKSAKDCRLSHGPHQCPFCSVKKADEYDLYQHEVDDHKIKIKFLCKMENCKEEKSSKMLLLQHQRRVHRIATQENGIVKVPRRCEDCLKTFCSQQSLNRHQERAEANPSVCKSLKSDDEDDVNYEESDSENEESESEVMLEVVSSQKSDEGMV